MRAKRPDVPSSTPCGALLPSSKFKIFVALHYINFINNLTCAKIRCEKWCRNGNVTCWMPAAEQGVAEMDAALAKMAP